MKIRVFYILFLILIFLQSYSQTCYIRAGKVFDGNQILDARIIAISNGLIEGIYENSYTIPDNSRIIDASNGTVLPGLIDSHIHFMGAPMPYITEIEKHSWGKLASEGMSLFPEHRLHLLLNGITSITDMGAPLKSYRKIDNAMANGKIAGPDLYYPGPLITAPGGHPAGTFYTGQHDLVTNGTFQVNDITKAKKEIKLLAGRKVDFIKIVYDRMSYIKGGVPRLSPEVAQAIAEESHKLGLKVIAHVGSENEAREMIRINVDGIEHGFATTSDSLFMAIKERNITFTPTLSAYDHYAPSAVPFMQKTVQRAAEFNVQLVVGTDYPSSYGEKCGDDIFKEMNLLEDNNVSRIEVLRGATHYAAEKIGKENEIGSIGKGYRANLVFYEGQIDTGRLTSSRISGTMLNGDMIIEKGMLVKKYFPFFKRKTSMVFPYGFYDAVTKANVGFSYTNFDLLNSGISLYSDAAWSTQNMWSINLRFFLPSPIKKTSLKSVFHFDNLNRLFYGIGNNTSNESKIEYRSVSFKENISATTTWNKYWKTACSLTLDQFKTYSEEAVSPTIIAGGNQTILTLSFIYDSRDHQNNPWKGVMLSLTPEFSPGFLGSTNQFGRLTLDVRGYSSIMPRNIFCARLLYHQSFGDVPWYYLPDFGGSVLGRGYYTSRFIDRAGIYAQAEYRFQIWKIISGIAFYDLGQVQKNAKDFKVNRFHHSYGFGPRFSFGSNENSILGMDFGFSNEGMMVFFHAGHAF